MSRTTAVLVLVLLVLLLALPLGAGMVMGGCPECHAPGGMNVVGACLAIVGGTTMLLGAFLVAVRYPLQRPHVLLLARSLDRPPRHLALS